MSGVLDSFEVRVPALAAQAQTQAALSAELRSAADAAYAAALAEHDEAIRSGSLLSGEVVARWQGFARTGDLIRTPVVRQSQRGAPPAKADRKITARAR